MKEALLIIGGTASGIALLQLYNRKTKAAPDENAADIAIFGIVGVAAIAAGLSITKSR